MRRPSGFSLIELIVVIVLISVGLLGLSRLTGGLGKAMYGTADLQTMSQYAQECAERVISTRRESGFASGPLTSTLCDPSPASYVRTLTLSTNYIGIASTPACPLGATCRDATVKVCAGSVSPCPTTAQSTSVTFMLVQY
jgi:prepilin-type N-terminal cleavage/methylation domain-containing protein